MPFIFIASIAAFQVLTIFLHLALYATIVTAFGETWSAVVAALFVVLAVSFPAMSFAVFRFKNRIVARLYTASAYWFGLAVFLFGGAVLFLIVAYNLYSWGIYVAPAVLGGVAFGAAFLVHLYGTLVSGRAGATRVSVTIPRLPVAWRRKKIVFMSDVHLGAVRGAKFAEKIARKALALAPEAVLIGGDLFDGVACDPDALIAPFRRLAAEVPHGVYFVPGNHDRYWNPEAVFAAIRNAGVHILDDKMADIAGIQLIGADYITTRKREDFEKILSRMNIDGKKPSILLKHDPNHLRVAEEVGISLELSGHTHHGQIFPLMLITGYAYRGFDYGLNRLGNLQIYTSSGVGTWAQPLRLGTKSEIVAITLN